MSRYHPDPSCSGNFNISRITSTPKHEKKNRASRNHSPASDDTLTDGEQNLQSIAAAANTPSNGAELYGTPDESDLEINEERNDRIRRLETRRQEARSPDRSFLSEDQREFLHAGPDETTIRLNNSDQEISFKHDSIDINELRPNENVMEGDEAAPPRHMQDAMLQNVIASIGRNMSRLTCTLDKFSGTDQYHRIGDFIGDFKKYLSETEAPWQSTLEQYLKSDAKEWYRSFTTENAELEALKDDNGKYTVEARDLILKEIEAHYSLNSNQKRTERARMFQSKQDPAEKFTEFVARVRKRARTLGMAEMDTVTICMNGAQENIRPFLMQAKPTSLSMLLKEPVATEEDIARPASVYSVTQTEGTNTNVVAAMQRIGEDINRGLEDLKKDIRPRGPHVGHDSAPAESAQADVGVDQAAVNMIAPRNYMNYAQGADFGQNYQGPRMGRYQPQVEQPLPQMPNVFNQPQMTGSNMALYRSYGAPGPEMPQKCGKCNVHCEFVLSGYQQAYITRCFAYDKPCYNCQRKGHFAILCRARGNQINSPAQIQYRQGTPGSNYRGNQPNNNPMPQRPRFSVNPQRQAYRQNGTPSYNNHNNAPR